MMNPVYKPRKQDVIIKKFVSMDFPAQLVYHAYEQCRGDENHMLEMLLNLK